MNKHVVYVPEQFVSEAKSLALEIAGGYTLSPAQEGAWRDDNGTVHYDVIHLLTVIESDREATNAILLHLFDGGELAVAVESNGQPQLIETPHLAA